MPGGHGAIAPVERAGASDFSLIFTSCTPIFCGASPNWRRSRLDILSLPSRLVRCLQLLPRTILLHSSKWLRVSRFGCRTPTAIPSARVRGNDLSLLAGIRGSEGTDGRRFVRLHVLDSRLDLDLPRFNPLKRLDNPV